MGDKPSERTDEQLTRDSASDEAAFGELYRPADYSAAESRLFLHG